MKRFLWVTDGGNSNVQVDIKHPFSMMSMEMTDVESLKMTESPMPGSIMDSYGADVAQFIDAAEVGGYIKMHQTSGVNRGHLAFVITRIK